MQGYSAYASLYISEYLKLGGEYHVEDYFSLKKSTNWSIFGGDKKFLFNPLIEEMDYKSVIAKISHRSWSLLLIRINVGKTPMYILMTFFH